MNRIVLYATPADLLAVLGSVEGQLKLRYVKVGDQQGPEPMTHFRAADIPALGIAKDGWMLREDQWYAMPRAVQVVVDEIPRPTGKPRYFVGSRLNPDAVLIQPGGQLDGRGIVQGIINPVSQSELAMPIFGSLRKAFRESFTTVGEVLVGPEAVTLYEGGMRLAHSLHSPPESDFQMTQV